MQTESAMSILLRDDPRYKFEAYILVFEGLAYAQKILDWGTERPEEEIDRSQKSKQPSDEPESAKRERHLTGQELSEAIRIYALEQYGMMARRVLNSMGIFRTGDFGEIVYNLIRIGEMGKTKDDRREDFDDVYDFEEGFDRAFKIEMPKGEAGKR